jgi:hypothetical protein
MDEKVVVVYIYTPDDGNSWDNPPEFLASGSMKTKISWRNKKKTKEVDVWAMAWVG